MTTGPNVDQSEFWNAQPGRNWVLHDADLDAISANVSGLLLAACAPAPGERALDVGCGAGASTFALAAAVGASGAVLGVDISAPLLRRAEERRAALGAGNVAFALADAQDHRFEPGAFDLAASRFGVMFFADPVAAFRNIAAGLRPGGRIAFAAWAGPEANPWFTLPQRVAFARLGPVAQTPPDAPGPMAFRDVDRVCGILAAAGFSAAEGTSVPTDLHHPGGVEAVVRLAAHVGPTARIMRENNGTAVDEAAIAAALAVELAQFRSDDGVRIPARVNIFTALRE